MGPKEKKSLSILTAAVQNAYKGCLPPFADAEKVRFHWLVACGQLIFPEYRFNWPELNWWNDENFNRYLSSFDELTGFNTERRWILRQLIRLTALVPGDTVECGCYKGASSYLICTSNANQSRFSRLHHIFDSFEGLSCPGELDGTHWSIHDLNASEVEVNAALSEFCGRYKLYKGWIPQRFPEISERTFSFVHIDVDLYEPTKESMAFFYPLLNTGGVLLCDDFGSSICPGATKAIDDYLRDKPEKMLATGSGSGFLIKGVAVDAESRAANITSEVKCHPKFSSIQDAELRMIHNLFGRHPRLFSCFARCLRVLDGISKFWNRFSC